MSNPIYGTKLNQIINDDYNDIYIDDLRSLLRAFDTLIQLNVVDIAISTPPVSPADGDAYFLQTGSTPTGDWSGQAGKIAVWRENLTIGTGNTPIADKWEFYSPNAGFILYNTADQTFYSVKNDFTIAALSVDALGQLNAAINDVALMTQVGAIGGDYFSSNEYGFTVFDAGGIQYSSFYWGYLSKGTKGGIWETDGGAAIYGGSSFLHSVNVYFGDADSEDGNTFLLRTAHNTSSILFDQWYTTPAKWALCGGTATNAAGIIAQYGSNYHQGSIYQSTSGKAFLLVNSATDDWREIVTL